jgi:AraC family transcriptional regulator of adaptative response/methylated-DNA-[protein]-cysteine methyltransferase
LIEISADKPIEEMLMDHLSESTTGRLRQCGSDGAELTVNRASYGPHGAGAQMQYTIAPSPFGQILIAATMHGVCWIGIHDSPAHLESELRDDYPEATIVCNDAIVADYARRAITTMTDPSASLDLPLDIRATPFQLAVWRELCAIPRGATRSYGEIAQRIGRPDARRAVGHANGSNPIAIIIPCHRAIGANGALTGYRWGVDIKRRLLEAESTIARRSFVA